MKHIYTIILLFVPIFAMAQLPTQDGNIIFSKDIKTSQPAQVWANQHFENIQVGNNVITGSGAFSIPAVNRGFDWSVAYSFSVVSDGDSSRLQITNFKEVVKPLNFTGEPSIYDLNAVYSAYLQGAFGPDKGPLEGKKAYFRRTQRTAQAIKEKVTDLLDSFK